MQQESESAANSCDIISSPPTSERRKIIYLDKYNINSINRGKHRIEYYNELTHFPKADVMRKREDWCLAQRMSKKLEIISRKREEMRIISE